MPCELHAVIGPNGAGKTTLINQISGLVAPDSGSILFGGRDITGLPVHARAAAGLARSFQVSSILPGFSALENVALAVQSRTGSSFRVLGRAAAEAALNDPAMAALADVGLGERAHVPAGELAHGEKRALELAIALARRPKVLLLDERMAGTGRQETARLVELLRRLKGRVSVLRGGHGMTAVFALAASRAAFEGLSLLGLPPYRIAQAGLGLVPEGRQIFATLSVEENLIVTRGFALRLAMDAGARLRFFPAACGAAPPHGQRAFRRRAADASDRSRAHDESQTAHPRRGNRRTGAAAAASDLAVPRPPEGGGPGH